VLAGFMPGGRAYGYRRVARFDEHGEPIHGLREVDPDEAAIVRGSSPSSSTAAAPARSRSGD
jgi:hypothetical protein